MLVHQLSTSLIRGRKSVGFVNIIIPDALITFNILSLLTATYNIIDFVYFNLKLTEFRCSTEHIIPLLNLMNVHL